MLHRNMSTVVQHGKYTVLCHTRENPREAAHVHVVTASWEARISLADGGWMDEPGSGGAEALRLFVEHRAACVTRWNEHHSTRKVV